MSKDKQGIMMLPECVEKFTDLNDLAKVNAIAYLHGLWDATHSARGEKKTIKEDGD